MAIQYVEHKFYCKSREKLDIVKALIEPYEAITLRGIHYLLVSNNVTENTPKAYNSLGELIKWARLTGEVPFDKIIDETREPRRQEIFDDPVDALRGRLMAYRSDWWIDQLEYIEVWLEKRTLTRIVYPVSNRYGVYLCVGGGYQSWSEIYDGKGRFEAYKNRPCYILYLGDFDPSGEDMDRDISERFDTLGCSVTVERVAITPGDAREHNLPPQFAKPTDTRTPAFVQKYGAYGWELDALHPNVLQAKTKAAIQAHCDVDLIEQHRKQDGEDRDKMAIWQGGRQLHWYDALDKDDSSMLSVLALDVDDARERLGQRFVKLEWLDKLAEWQENGRTVWKVGDYLEATP